MPLDSALTKYGAYRPAICTSTTRPASPYTGQMVFETDTFSVRMWTGSAWVGTTPAGAIQQFAGATAPVGWLLCFGQAVSRSTYADLFAALGTTHGAGDGSTTFNIPDLRGRVAAGKDNMGGSSANRLVTNVAGGTLGATGGAESHTLTGAQIPAHNHIIAYGTSYNGGTNGVYITGASADSSEGQMTRSSGGSGGAHNNTQPTIILNYIIKV